MEKILKQVKDKAPVELPADIPDAGNLLEAANPLGNGVTGMITNQLMQPPTLYYLIGFGLLIALIIFGVIYSILKVKKVSERVDALYQGDGVAQGGQQNFANAVANTMQGQQSNQFQFQGQMGYQWPDGSPMTKEEYDLEQKDLAKRTTLHLIKTAWRVTKDPRATRVGNIANPQGFAPQQQLQPPMQTPMQPPQMMQPAQPMQPQQPMVQQMQPQPQLQPPMQTRPQQPMPQHVSGNVVPLQPAVGNPNSNNGHVR